MTNEVLSLMLYENETCHQWNNKSVKVTSLESKEDKYTWIIILQSAQQRGNQAASSYY